MKVIDYTVQVVQDLHDLPRVYAEATRKDKIRLLKGFVSEIKIDENRAIAFVSRPGFNSVMRTKKLVGPGNPPRRAGSGSRQPAPRATQINELRWRLVFDYRTGNVRFHGAA